MERMNRLIFILMPFFILFFLLEACFRLFPYLKKDTSTVMPVTEYLKYAHVPLVTPLAP